MWEAWSTWTLMMPGMLVSADSAFWGWRKWISTRDPETSQYQLFHLSLSSRTFRGVSVLLQLFGVPPFFPDFSLPPQSSPPIKKQYVFTGPVPAAGPLLWTPGWKSWSCHENLNVKSEWFLTHTHKIYSSLCSELGCMSNVSYFEIWILHESWIKAMWKSANVALMLVGVGLHEYWSFGGLRMLAVYNTVVDSPIVAGSRPERELE